MRRLCLTHKATLHIYNVNDKHKTTYKYIIVGDMNWPSDQKQYSSTWSDGKRYVYRQIMYPSILYLYVYTKYWTKCCINQSKVPWYGMVPEQHIQTTCNLRTAHIYMRGRREHPQLKHTSCWIITEINKVYFIISNVDGYNSFLEHFQL